LRIMSAILFSLSLLLGQPALASDMRQVSGQIMVMERMALPENTTIIVDLSTTGDTGLSATRLPSEGAQSPFDFTIEAPTDMDTVLRVGVRAWDDTLWLSEPLALAAGTDPVDLGTIRVLRIPPMGFVSLLACGNTLVEVGFMPEALRIRLNEQVISMEPQPAASGALFVSPDNAATSVHMKDDAALLRIDGAELSECRILRSSVDFTQGVWNISSINDKPTLFPSRTEFVFYPDGRMSATVGCNRFIGGYRRHGGVLSFGRIASTRMACPEGLTEQENQFNAVLPTIDGYRLDFEAGRLTLLSQGRPVIQARK